MKQKYLKFEELTVFMKLEEVKRLHPDEWVLVEVLDTDTCNRPKEVRLIAYSRNRDDIYDRLKDTEGVDTFQFFTTGIPKKGYAAIFYVSD